MPRESDRFKMPRAARSDRKNLSGTFGSGTMISVSVGCDDEHAPSTLRHSEEAAVENPPSHAVPEVGQRSNNDSEVPTAVATEQPRYVLEENPSRSKSVDDSGDLEEESCLGADESCSLSGDGHVLAGESSSDEIKRNGAWVSPPLFANAGATGICLSSRRWFDTHISYVVVDGDSGPVVGEHSSSPLVRLAEEGVLEPGSGQSIVHPSDSAEEAADIHLTSSVR